MRKAVKKQPTQATLTADAEPFADVAARAGAALADLVSHEDCPRGFHDQLSKFMTDLASEYDTLAIDFRGRFAAFANRAVEENRERPTLMAA